MKIFYIKNASLRCVDGHHKHHREEQTTMVWPQ